jgi:hypothetical protein
MLAVASIGISGCLYAALAPMALSAAADVGSGTMHLAESAAAEAHQRGADAAPGYHPGEDEMEREDRCAHLPFQTPGVIELRKDASGSTEYRELRIFSSSDGARWMPVVGKDTDSDGWRPAVNFLKMSFSPPLADALPQSGPSYLAYAPSAPVSAAENDQLSALTSSFGVPSGSFNWNERAYRFSITPELPCYRPPS